MKVEILGHQGDVLVFKLSGSVEGEKLVDKQMKDGILAYGEGSGHAHQIAAEDLAQANVELFKVQSKAYEGLLFLKTDKAIDIEHGRARDFEGTEADHDYHNPISIPEGNTMFGIAMETDWLTRVVRRVVD